MSLTKATFSMIANGYINVKDYGAVGDGATDDTDAIKAAVAAGMAFQQNAPGYGSQTEITVFFPRGKYRISDVIPVNYGTNLLGEQSGLVNAGDTLSTGTVLLLSDTKPGGAAWTSSTVVGGNTIAKRVMFSVIDGGPIQMRNFGAITEGNNSVDSVFLLAGNDFNVPYNSVGVTQALFSGLRVFAFESVFLGSRFADVTIENCGFEYNRAVFQPVAGTKSGNYGYGGINAVTTQFFANFYTTSIPNGASMNDSNFSACIFSLADNANYNCFQGSSGGDLSNVHFSACDFIPGTSSTGSYFSNTGTDFLMQDCTFSSCRFKSNPAFSFAYSASQPQYFRNNTVNGCFFEDSNISIAYEDVGNTFCGNTFSGTSVITTSQSTDLVINSNNFSACSTNPPIVFNDVITGVSVSNNVFDSAVTGIAVNGSSTRVKMVGNVYFADVNMP